MAREIPFADDPYYLRFKKPSWSKNTQNRCIAAFRAYFEFYEQKKGLMLTPEKALERIQEDRKKPLLEQGDVEREWLEFAQWMKDEYKKKHFKNTSISAATIRAYTWMIKNFYKDFGFPLSHIATLPRSILGDKGKIENRKTKIRAKQVKTLLDVMRNNKDKAITLMMFQSGMDQATLFSLTYGDVRKALENDDAPVIIEVKRAKTKIIYKTCLGRDALQALRTYLREREEIRWKCGHCGASWGMKRKTCPYCKKGGVENPTVTEYRVALTSDSFLFLSHQGSLRAGINNFSNRFKQYALLSGIVSEDEVKKADFCPSRPYALRQAFSSILNSVGVPDAIREYMMGHCDKYSGAYFNLSDEELLKHYKKCEEELSVSEVKELEDVEKKFQNELRKRDLIIEGMEKRLDETEHLLNNLSQSLVDTKDEDTEKTAEKLVTLIFQRPDLLRKVGAELKKLES